MEYTIQKFKDFSERIGGLDDLSHKLVEALRADMLEVEEAAALGQERGPAVAYSVLSRWEVKMRKSTIFSENFKREVVRTFELAGKQIRRGGN